MCLPYAALCKTDFITCLTLENIEHNNCLHVFYFCNIARNNFFSCVYLPMRCAERISSGLPSFKFHRTYFLCLYFSMLQNKYHSIFSMRHSEQQFSLCLLPAIRACINFFFTMFLPGQHYCARLISSCV